MSNRRSMRKGWLWRVLGQVWLVGLCCWCQEAEASREIAVEIRPGYRHNAAVSMFKRNLRLQGWRVTGSARAPWRVRLCAASHGVVCMGHGARWQSFKTPRKQLTPSTRARLLLLYFNMMRQQGQKASAAMGGCHCGKRAPRRRPAVRRSRPRRRPKRISPRPRPQPRRPVPRSRPQPPRRTSFQPSPAIPAQPVVKKAAPPIARRPKPRKVALLDDDRDDFDFGEMVGERTLPKKRERSWSFWGGVGASADLHWLDASNAMPGGTLHLHMGWGSLGFFGSLHFHAYFVNTADKERAIMLFRPTFGLDWIFQPRPSLGRVRLAFGLQLGVTTEHGIVPKVTASNGAYDHHLQVGPMVGFQLLLLWSERWAMFWRSELAVTFKPDLITAPLDPNDMGVSWRNSLGIQYRSNFF